MSLDLDKFPDEASKSELVGFLMPSLTICIFLLFVIDLELDRIISIMRVLVRRLVCVLCEVHHSGNEKFRGFSDTHIEWRPSIYFVRSREGLSPDMKVNQYSIYKTPCCDMSCTVTIASQAPTE